MRRWIAIGAVAAAAAVAAGCGGDDTKDVSATTEWAGGVCTALVTWKDAVAGAGDSLEGGNLSTDAVKSAAGDIEDATGTLADDLKALGRPDTEAGQQAEDTITTLADDLSGEADTIRNTVDEVSGVSDALQAASTVSSTLKTMGEQVGSAVSELEALDGAQELRDAFEQADSCKSLTGS